MSRPRIAVIGLPYFARRTAKSLRTAGYDARFVAQPGRSLTAWPGVIASLLRADLVYAIGSESRRNSPVDLIARARKRVLMHWVGSDVVAAVDAHRSGVLSQPIASNAEHWADAPWLVDELATIGITAREILLPVPAVIGSPQPLPDTFAVLIYLPGAHQSDYDIESTIDVVRAMPGTQFLLVGGYEPDVPLPNLEVLGYVRDMPAVYARTTVFLRLTHHDGMSHSVIEALSFARYAVWSAPYAGAIHVDSAAAAIDALAALQHEHDQGTLAPNSPGAAAVADSFAPENVLAAVKARLDHILS